jgi:hypothetical protein
MKMDGKTKMVLGALLFFGSASSVFAGTNLGNDHGSVAPRRAVPLTMSADRTGAVYQAVKPVAAEEKAWFAPPQLTLVQGAPFCRHGITDSTMVWIKLTAPGGGMIHINVEQVVSVRSDTQIPGANAQLDLASGKLQGVRENVDQVMQVITAAAGARANGECA